MAWLGPPGGMAWFGPARRHDWALLLRTVYSHEVEEERSEDNREAQSRARDESDSPATATSLDQARDAAQKSRPCATQYQHGPPLLAPARVPVIRDGYRGRGDGDNEH
jgi:hypothetical protein